MTELVKQQELKKKYVEEAIEFVGLDDYKKFLPKKLSGGLLRRLNIACGIAHKPKLIFFDEPTVAVDPQSRNKILEGIMQLNKEGATIVYTSHYMEEVEQICIDVFMGMWNWAQQYSDRFGGFFMYSYYNWINPKTGLSHANAKAYLCPDENGDIKWKRLYPVLEAVGNGFNEGKLPNEIELPEVEYDKGYIV